ncbi:MAG: hypothetical protein R3C49_06710 [Planctomycetaceae bacterium]
MANGDSFSGAYTAFGALEPSGGATENHLEFDVNAGQWNDLSGSSSRAYFIEWNADDVLDATNALTYSINPKPWPEPSRSTVTLARSPSPMVRCWITKRTRRTR